jgi:stage II sporulation protein P
MSADGTGATAGQSGGTNGTDSASQTESRQVRTLDMDSYREFDKLIEDFYAIDSTTYIDASELSAEKLMQADMTLDETAGEPQILIYHTHSQEGYADTPQGDSSKTVVGAGEELAQLLTEQYGFSVLHHTGQYDVDGRDYAYANAAPALEQLLEENPSIQVIIDLHRDGVADNTRLVTEINGKKTAKFMFFNGLSRLKNTGEISYLYNANREQNLAFSFQLQKKCMEYYPGITRSIYLKGYRYNMQYRGKSLLVELGAQTNTFEEVENALPPLAHVLAMVLRGE